MSEYSDALDTYATTIDPADDNYEDKLKEVAASFRGFNDALTTFIMAHGYSGDAKNSNEKVAFMKEKFAHAHIKPPRYIENWFDSADWKTRETAYKICFALNLDIKDTNDFFRRVQFERSFDCHKINEAVYYFCIKNNYKYQDAEQIIAQINEAAVTGSVKKIPNYDVLYTNSIVHEINKISDEKSLVAYITQNIENFSYNNVTAVSFIKKLWNNISGTDGLAKKEGEYIEKQLNLMPYDANNNQPKFLEDHYVISSEDSSSWTIYTQILGLDRMQESRYSSTRSLASVFSKNVLLPLKASSCFPSSLMLNSILRGEQGDNERYRKMLILLVFYSFWAKKTIEQKNVYIKADSKDQERCLSLINKYLVDAGYPTLYYGNPYDWIFMWALCDKNPLFAFRSYILEVMIVANEGCD